MSGTWYPSLHDQLEAEQRLIDRHADSAVDDNLDWESVVDELIADGNVEALMALREQLSPVHYDELGWSG